MANVIGADMQAITQKEEARFYARVGMFVRRGLSKEQSNDFAERCFFRDRDGDDRRGCVECVNLQHGGKCRGGSQAFELDLLHRCHRFGWQIPRTN